eukprot:gene2554-3163_t
MSQIFFSKVRSIVSADRHRFKADDLDIDLDLSYITPNIVAMSFPGSGIEATWRNSIKDVCSLLNNRHNGKFMIWNLSERKYDYSKFNNQILDFPFPDHHAPSLNLLFEIVNSLDNWLKADSENIAVVHCKGGKGRTGTIICCYLYYSCQFEHMEESMKHFAEKRSKKKKGVTQPSQQRYINYFKEIVSGSYMIEEFSRTLSSIELGPLTREQASSISIEIFEHGKEAVLALASSPATLEIIPLNGESQSNLFKVVILVGKRMVNDVLIRVYKGNTGKRKGKMKKQIFHLIFNIAFIEPKCNRIVFTKKDLDHFKKAEKRYPDSFSIECLFQNGCSTSPDHSFKIWNIMSMKYQRTRAGIKSSNFSLDSIDTSQLSIKRSSTNSLNGSNDGSGNCIINSVNQNNNSNRKCILQLNSSTSSTTSSNDSSSSSSTSLAPTSSTSINSSVISSSSISLNSTNSQNITTTTSSATSTPTISPIIPTQHQQDNSANPNQLTTISVPTVEENTKKKDEKSKDGADIIKDSALGINVCLWMDTQESNSTT